MKEVLLEEVCEAKSSNIAIKDLDNNNGEYPIYGASGFIKNVDFYKFDKPYIAIVKDGAGVGRVMLLPAKSSIIGTMQAIIPNETIDINYLYNVLVSKKLSKYYTGATIPHIYFKDYKNEKINIYSIEEQKNISIKLTNVNNLIRIKTDEINKLDELIKSQFVEMFEGKDFEKKTLQEITTKITDGSHNPPSGIAENLGYMMLSSQNIINDKINYRNARYLSKEDFEKENMRTDLKNGDILLTIVGTVGRTAIIKNEKNITLQRSVAVLKPIKEINSDYLVDALKSDYFVKQLNKGAKGVAQKGIYLNDLKKLTVLVPPIDLQKKFAKFVEQTDKQKFEFEKQLKKLEELQASLMQEYFG